MQLTSTQSEAHDKASEWICFALFMTMGTGKTRVAVELANKRDCDLLVYIAPLRLIDPKDPEIKSVKEEVAKWGGFKAKEVIYIGVETIGQSDRQYLQIYSKIRTAWNPMIIVDESIKIKNHDAKRTKRVLELGKMAGNKLILNGEPITRDLLDIYPQMQFLDPRILNMSLAEFKNTFCKYTTIIKYNGRHREIGRKEFITGYENIDYLYSLIGQYVYECDLDLGVKQIFETKYYTLDDEAQEQYTYLKERYLDDEMLLLKNNNIFLELTMKMQHQYCITPEKFDLVDGWIKDKAEDKLIIYCKYIASRETCQKRYPGAVVLNYKSGSHGYNLQVRPYMIFFDGTFDWGDVSQGMKRNFRLGQKMDCRYLTLEGGVNLETLIRKNNNKKAYMAEYFKETGRNYGEKVS